MKPNSKTMRQTEIGRAAGTMEHADFVPTEAQVRALAHEIYRVRCDRGEDGDEMADWIAAECELKRGDKNRAGDVPSSARDGESVATLVRSDRAPTA